MRKILALTLVILSAVASAESKTLPISSGKVIKYETPDGWMVFKKNAPPASPMQMIKIEKDASIQIQIMLLSIEGDNPIITSSVPEKFVHSMHSTSCVQYVESSVEGEDKARAVKGNDYLGYISTFTDKKYANSTAPTGQYKYVTRVTHLIGGQKTGLIASFVILSNQVSGPDYEAAIQAVNSFGLQS